MREVVTRTMLVGMLVLCWPIAAVSAHNFFEAWPSNTEEEVSDDLAVLYDLEIIDEEVEAIPLPRGVAYELQEGSTLTYTSASSVEPGIATTVDIRGEFCRFPTNVKGLYKLDGVCFKGSNDGSTKVSVRGTGWYQSCCSSASLIAERMVLCVDIKGFPKPDDILVVMDSGEIWLPDGEFPTIIIDLKQISVSSNRYFTMHLIATPKRDIGFSTEKGFEADNPTGTNSWISDGDLLRSSGVVVRTNHALMQNFGIMPPIPDVGLDAVTHYYRCPDYVSSEEIAYKLRRCVLFSIEETIWSERLQCWLGHGDLLCERGMIFRTNAELLQAFGPTLVSTGVGLDAAHINRDKTIWFSTEEGFWGHTASGLVEWISPDDLLSDEGYVVKTIWELLANFTPIAIPVSPGLDAVVVRPNGEIYFSLEVGFMDAVYGNVSPGDLLSDAGYVVARNRELIENFHPDDVRDVGLDAVHLGNEQGCPIVVAPKKPVQEVLEPVETNQEVLGATN